jgi:hypothetical protein
MPSYREEGNASWGNAGLKVFQWTQPSFFFVLVSRKEVMDILERKFQARLIRRIHDEMPDAVVLKTDPNYIQGFPDLLILRGKRWASLEVKREEHAPHRPNQDYWIQKLNRMSFARFIYPENEEEILHDIRHALRPGRAARLPESKPVSLDQLHKG